MQDLPFETIEALPQEIWRIDTAYQKPGVAACYLLRGAEEYALIECGTGLSVGPILQALDALNVSRDAVRRIIPTHVHLDHAGGAGGLMQALPNAQLHVHARGARHLIDPTRLLAGAMAVYGETAFRRANGEILPAPADRTHAVADGEILQIGPRRLELRDAPGHAKHHLVVWDAQSQGFFTGDVFGLCYPALQAQGRPFIAPTTTPVQFDPEAWENTLLMLASYQPQRMYLTHYGMVEGVAALADELAQRLRQHATLAKHHRELDEIALARVLGDALYAAYLDQGGSGSRQVFEQVLGMDLRLNAQGLLHWQQQA